VSNFTSIIYLGDSCNQSCSYCDRQYIKDEIGSQRISVNDIPRLVEYVKSITTTDKHIGFHGGEPFLYVKEMTEIIESLPGFQFSILTNGTLLERNIKFLESYKDRLRISISYDFLDTEKQRGYSLDIEHVLDILKDLGIGITQLQWVIDITNRDVFNSKVVKNISDLYSKYNLGMLTLIPMRHIRGKAKFRSIIDEADIQGFMRGFLQFIQLLYVLRIKVSIDGHIENVDKDYFNDHKQIILSPDGYIYPEFDFLDYRVKKARIGNWKEGKLDRLTGAEVFLTKPLCRECSEFYSCGIKYLYYLFKETPSGECEQFYKILGAVIDHNRRLNKYKNLIEAVQ